MRIHLILSAILTVASILLCGPVEARILITPQRVVFGEGDRAQSVVINNTSDEALVYRIGWSHLRQTASGGYEPIDVEKDPFRSAHDMIRFSPRQVVLAPGQSQTIRLMLRRPKGLEDGEYRSHLLLQAVPKTRDVDEGGTGVSVKIDVLIGFSIPVIVRSGKLDAVASLGDVSVSRDQDGAMALNVDVTRDGPASPYGRLRVLWDRGRGTPEQVGLLNNIAVFPEIETRRVPVTLNRPIASEGTLQIVYDGLNEYEGRLFAERTFRLQ